MLVLASDHLIQNQLAFNQAVQDASLLAQQGYLVTFGIKPTAPETGFGYIEAGSAIGAGFKVQRFVEKPSLEVAQQYLAAGNYSWNSGMFCFSATSLLTEMVLHAPDIFNVAKECYQATQANKNAELFVEFDADSFSRFNDVSIDYALMEKSERVAMIEATFDWSDIGSWDAVAGLLPADSNGNRLNGDMRR